ncbi:MAG: TRCF domain-containing protein, partial [Oscillospiraceae bacterium]
RTPKQQTAILQKLKEGRIDIIIGTHRLVQKDIKFKDLGLAIVDEEQRFGVKHKEHFKEMFTDVDMLTLSATPIPRTLNMAISGIRDMSTIEQAPQDRHPVQSYVLEHDNAIIADAIKKELRRGGQVYYIHNRVETIDLCASKINSYVPEARIAVAHGQMDEKDITEIWRQLIEHEIDILVCTTIIETGVDVANCNTLVIENADRMGLSQLYQLRGRVGRSNRRAYAYFTFTRGKVLTEIANKRLSAIREFTKFGSGFRIAMRDLEIRGAGNILGAKQHGHMEAVGYDMYLRLLSEAISLKKGEPVSNKTFECLIDLRLDAHIPENYIEDTSNRIDIYRRIASIKSQEDSLDVTDELIDRFGEPPKSVLSLVDVALLRNTLASFGFEEISEKPNGILLYPNHLDMELAQKLISLLKNRVLVNASKRPYIQIKQNQNGVISTLREVITALQSFD